MALFRGPLNKAVEVVPEQDRECRLVTREWDFADCPCAGMLRSMDRIRLWRWLFMFVGGLLLAPPGATAQGSAAVAANPVTLGEKLVWADEFDPAEMEPDPAHWTYETGGGGWGNAELEVYCSPRTTDAPCDPVTRPNSFVGDDGMLHIVARRTAPGQWTSARAGNTGSGEFPVRARGGKDSHSARRGRVARVLDAGER